MNAEVWCWGPRECRQGSLGEDLLQGFFAGVKAEASDVKLGAATTATTAAAAAAITTAVTTSSVIASAITASSVVATVASTRGVTRRGWTAGFARGATRTMPASFRHC